MENPVSERMRDYEIERAVKEREKSLFEEKWINDQKEIRKKALEILKNDDPIDYIIKIHQKLHIGNKGVAKLLLLSIGCQSIEDSKGLQVSISGKSGKGKTHCCRSMLRLMPKEYVVDAPYLDKAAFSDKKLKKGLIIFIDDIKLNKHLNTTIKRATGDFQNETIHTRTVDNPIPARTVWWLTSVDEKYTEELLNRMFKIKIDESLEQDEKVNNYQKKIAKTGNRELPNTEETEICREIIKIIKSKGLFKTRIPYSNNIKFNSMRDGRKNDRFLDIIKAFSVFNYKQRKTNNEGYLIADIDDFNNAAKFYNKYGIVHYYELTAQEIEMCEILQGRKYHSELRYGAFTTTDLVKFMNLSATRIRQITNRIEKEFEGLGVFDRYFDKHKEGGRTYLFLLDDFDLKMGSLDHVSYVSSDKDEEVDEEEKKVNYKADFTDDDKDDDDY